MKKKGIIIGIVVVLVLGGLLIWWFTSKDKKPTDQKENPSKQEEVENPTRDPKILKAEDDANKYAKALESLLASKKASNKKAKVDYDNYTKTTIKYDGSKPKSVNLQVKDGRVITGIIAVDDYVVQIKNGSVDTSSTMPQVMDNGTSAGGGTN